MERLRSARPHLFVGRDAQPIVFVERVGNAVRLASVDATAAALGLTPGLTLADARARIPALEVFDADPHGDHDWLETLADACSRYTPSVALDPPDGLVLDIAGCVHAFDGERRLAVDVEARMGRRGVLARHAFGDTPDAARALARFAGAPAPDEQRALKRLPVAALGLDADAIAALVAAGLKTVGDVAQRPLAGIAARFGADAATRVRRLFGEAQSPLSPRRTVQPIGVERRFAEPIARTEYALTVIEELVAEAGILLERRHEGGRRFEARLFRADGLVQRLRVETGRPTRDVAVLGRLFRERIDALSDPLDPGFGYDMIRLEVIAAERIDASQLKLEGGEGGQQVGQQVGQQGGSPAVDALVDQLATRLGRGRVRRFAARDSHVPEQAELTLPVGDARPPAAWIAPEAGEPPLRPIYLFDPPQLIEGIVAEVPDGPPRVFRWRRKVHEIARAEGPERIAGEWWRRHDSAVPTRDYYRVEDRRGRRFWIFRHGLFEETDSPKWYVHGVFA